MKKNWIEVSHEYATKLGLSSFEETETIEKVNSILELNDKQLIFYEYLITKINNKEVK